MMINQLILKRWKVYCMLTDNYLKNNLSNLKCFVSHGSVDQVVPVEWGRKAKPFLENLGVSCEYKEYPIGHGISPQNFNDLLQWLDNK